MSAITITVEHAAVSEQLRALARRSASAAALRAALASVGDEIVHRAKSRFATARDPAGRAWQPLAAATLAHYAAGLRRSYRKKGGALNARGLRRVAARRPLSGETGDLKRQIFARATITGAQSAVLSVTAGMKYAAIHQFGGRAGRGRRVRIPARPFLPIAADGRLWAGEAGHISADLSELLLGTD